MQPNVVTNVPKTKTEEIETVIERLRKLTSAVYKDYREQLFDPKFCNRLSLIMNNKLDELPLYQLKELNNKINTNNKSVQQRELKIIMSYQPRFDEKFLMNNLRGDLKDLFYKTNIDFHPVEGLQLNAPKWSYINPKEITGVTRIKKPRNKQNGGQNENNNQDENQNINFNNVENNFNTNNNNLNNININKNTNNLSRLLSNRKVKNTNTTNVKQNITNNKNVNLKKQDKIMLSNIENLLNNNKSKQKNTLSKLNKYNVDNKVENKNGVDDVKLCNDTTKDCYLTKTQICERIKEHYRYRTNILVSILSALPQQRDEKNMNSWVGSFCYNRYRALKDSKICLPPDLEKIKDMSLDEKVKVLSNYINQIGFKACKSVNGNYKTFDEKQRVTLASINNTYNKFYLKYTLELHNDYLNSINKLLEIVQLLESDKLISTEQLMQIGAKTKEILDNMYSRCQYNYIMAILALLRADTNPNKQERESQQKEIILLQKGLEV